jgi:alanine racemase
VLVLTIDLHAIQKNWLQLVALSRTNVAGVIKANAYSLGAKEVGNALYTVGCREFFLASFEEASAARSYLPADTLIYVLGGLRNIDLAELHERGITPVLCSAYDIEQWLAFKKKVNINAIAALKINTGMTRFGLDENEFSSLCNNIERLKAINPALLISHLSCADDSNQPQNHRQLNRFVKSLGQIKKVLPSIRASLANSSGIFLGKDWHFDLVRPGAALYGINPTPLEINPMNPVLRLTLPILQIRTLSNVEFIGYGATANLSAGARVAVVAGGYADGAHRSLGGQPEGMLLGCKVKAIGRISMDSMMFDISNVNESEDKLMNASIDVVGDHFPLDVLMAKNHSLGYEVLTSLGSRYQRHYLPGV